MKCTDCQKEFKKLVNDFHLCSRCYKKFQKKWVEEAFENVDPSDHS